MAQVILRLEKCLVSKILLLFEGFISERLKPIKRQRMLEDEFDSEIAAVERKSTVRADDACCKLAK